MTGPEPARSAQEFRYLETEAAVEVAFGLLSVNEALSQRHNPAAVQLLSPANPSGHHAIAAPD
jgi:hypothetical protein